MFQCDYLAQDVLFQSRYLLHPRREHVRRFSSTCSSWGLVRDIVFTHCHTSIDPVSYSEEVKEVSPEPQNRLAHRLSQSSPLSFEIPVEHGRLPGMKPLTTSRTDISNHTPYIPGSKKISPNSISLNTAIIQMKSSPPDTHTHTDLAREHTHWSIYIKLKSLGENITCMYPPSHASLGEDSGGDRGAFLSLNPNQ